MIHGIALNWQGLTGVDWCIIIQSKSISTHFVSGSRDSLCELLDCCNLGCPWQALGACCLCKNHSPFFPGVDLKLSTRQTWMGRRFPYIGLNCVAGLFFIINCFLPRCSFDTLRNTWCLLMDFASDFFSHTIPLDSGERMLTRCLLWSSPWSAGVIFHFCSILSYS